MDKKNYVSVEAKEFYKDFNTSIADVSKAVGLARATVTKLVDERTNMRSTERIVDYLEEINLQDYNYSIGEYTVELRQLLKKIKEAWDDYERKEEVLKKYRRKYGLQRKKSLAVRMKVKDVLKKAVER